MMTITRHWQLIHLYQLSLQVAHSEDSEMQHQLNQQHLAQRQQEASVVPVALVLQLRHQQQLPVSEQVRQFSQHHNTTQQTY
jgi:hypothetical protein